MHRRILRSIVAILVGWVVAVGGYVMAMLVIALFHQETFSPGVQLSTGWWLVNLFVGLVSSVVGGFVTGVIAQRREVIHAAGLVLFGLLVYMCWPSGQEDTASVPTWYTITAYVLTIPSTILGGWLRARQDVPIQRMPESMIRTVDNIRLSMAITVDRFRFPIAAASSVVVFVIGVRLGLLLTGVVLLVIQRFFEPESHGGAIVAVGPALSLFLPALLCRYVYRKIMAVDTSLLDDRHGSAD
jgi:hypothetical protein